MTAIYSGDLAQHLRTFAGKITDGDISGADLNRLAAVAVRFLHGEGLLLPREGTYRIGEDGQVSDGHHTFKELYEYRLLYNAALFNEWAAHGLYDVHKSTLHHDGTVPFGDPKWFIVVAELPNGQISNHYRMDDWDLFDIPGRVLPNVYDGHTPAVVAQRLRDFLVRRIPLT